MKTMRSCARTERPYHNACDSARADGHASGRSNGIRLSDRALMNVLPVAADQQDGLWDRAWGNGSLTAIPAPQRARAQTQRSFRGVYAGSTASVLGAVESAIVPGGAGMQ